MWYWIILVFFSDKDYENYLEINKKKYKKRRVPYKLAKQKTPYFGIYIYINKCKAFLHYAFLQ